MKLFLVENDAYVVAEDRLDALNTYLRDQVRLGIELPDTDTYTVSKPLYGTKLLTFPFPIGSSSENFKETSVSTWIELCDGTGACGAGTVLGYQNI